MIDPSIDSTTQSSGSITIIKTDPYAIHYSNSPSTVLITPLLTGDNYDSLSRAAAMALRAKRKCGFVDGNLLILKDKDVVSNWEWCNGLVGSWILNLVSPDIHPRILYADTVPQIWADLEEWLSQTIILKIYQLKQSLTSHK